MIKTYKCSRYVGENSGFIKYGRTISGKQRYQYKYCKTINILDYTYNAYEKDINQKIILLTKEDLGIRSTAGILKIYATTVLKKNFDNCG